MQLNDGTRTGEQKRNIIVMAELIRIIISDICCILEANITVRITASRVKNRTNKLRVNW